MSASISTQLAATYDRKVQIDSMWTGSKAFFFNIFFGLRAAEMIHFDEQVCYIIAYIEPV